MINATTDQEWLAASVGFKNARGEPAPVEAGSVVWASSDDTVLAVTPSADGMTASVKTVAPGGPARITVSADADIGSGVQTITGFTDDVTVTLGPNSAASVVALDLGAATEKP